jgi:hypothetical protein
MFLSIRFLLVLSFSLILLTSCDFFKSKNEKESEKNRAIQKLIDKYDISFKWDTTNVYYSIDYDTLLTSKYQLIDRFVVKDIVKRDSLYYVLILVEDDINMFFQLPIKTEYIKLFRKSGDLVLVVNIQKFRKFNLKIEDEQIDEYTFIQRVEGCHDVLLIGEIVELVSFNTEKE